MGTVAECNNLLWIMPWGVLRQWNVNL
uniref:Uncharacterized protein n=1 Tax=Arundo donax TaxID=35708 RepID=A0A0A9HKA5_ARUDO